MRIEPAQYSVYTRPVRAIPQIRRNLEPTPQEGLSTSTNADRVSLSAGARTASTDDQTPTGGEDFLPFYGRSAQPVGTPGTPDQAASGDGSQSAQGSTTAAVGRGNGGIEGLTTAELEEIRNLGTRDREVKAHEQAHLAAAGAYATSGAQYSYTRGPEGKQYATAGEVGIDLSPVKGDPEATALKADTIQRAALAPADPSGQDRSVAAQAAQMAQQARADMVTQQNPDKPQSRIQRGFQRYAAAKEQESTIDTEENFTQTNYEAA